MLVDDPNWPTENDMDDESFLSSRCIYICVASHPLSLLIWHREQATWLLHQNHY